MLMNTKGMVLTKPLTECSVTDSLDVIELNVEGRFLPSKYAIPAMIGKRKGPIVNVASSSGRVGAVNSLGRLRAVVKVKVLPNFVSLGRTYLR